MLEGSCHCGAVTWTYSLPLESVTACNCTLCRRYGALWAYGSKDQGVKTSGPTKFYQNSKKVSSYNYCANCACLMFYLVNRPDEDGLYKIAVNVRMINDPEKISDLPIDHFDGLDSFDDLPRDDRTVKHLWF